MSQILNDQKARVLQKLVVRYRDHAGPADAWKRKTPDQLWLKVLSQIVVVGDAGAGYELERNRRIQKKVSLAKLKKFRSDEALQRHLHQVLGEIGARYVSQSKGDWKKDRKAAAAAHNFRVLMEAGGPRRFFEQVAALDSEHERIRFLRKGQKPQRLKYYGKKGARDTLIELGLAENCMALDARIQRLLKKLGVKIKGSIDRNYEDIERELIERVAKPCGISGGKLDRILFQNYRDILAGI